MDEREALVNALIKRANPVHDGPGHKFGDPGYCGGCWYEQIGAYREADRVLQAQDDSPAARAWRANIELESMR